MEKVIFISSALQQPRHQKRIDLLSQKFDLDVYYFERDKYRENYKDYVSKAHSLGVVKDGKYLGRILQIIKLFYILLKSPVSVVYCTSPEQMAVACLAGKKVFFEVGDLYQVDGWNRIFSVIDWLFIRRIACLVLTSPFYYSGYFNRFEKYLKGRVVIVENKLPISMHEQISDFRDAVVPVLSRDRIRVGVIGSLSFRKSLTAISQLMAVRKDLELHIYGDGLYDIFNGLENAHYHGRFKNPEDLNEIYSSIDINFILYDYDNNNVKLALPNKLYESIAFLKPIICSPDVALSRIVESNGYGISATAQQLSDAVDEVSANYGQYVERLKNANDAEFLCYEQEQIISKIEDVFR